jgi:hypothetical protein
MSNPVLNSDVILACLGLPCGHAEAESQQWWHPTAVVNVELEAGLERLIRGNLAVTPQQKKSTSVISTTSGCVRCPYMKMTTKSLKVVCLSV